jgi:NADPH-dependent ferric siderophore reductase
MDDARERPPVADPRNVFLAKRKEGNFASSEAGDEYGLITASALLSGIFPVVGIADITPHLRRVTLTGEGLAQARGCWEPGLEVRAVFPTDGRGALGPAGPLVVPRDVKPAVRTYTVRSFDDDRLELALDIVLHDHGGVGSAWAHAARPGDLLALAMRYPESSPRDHEADWYLLVGDDTAAPAIGSFIETMPAGAKVRAFIEVADQHDEQVFSSLADVELTWLHRGSAPAASSRLLVDAVRNVDWLDGRAFVFAGAEVRIVSQVRRHVREAWGLTRHNYKMSAYWRSGMTEPERLAKVKENVAPLVAEGVDMVEIYSERGLLAPDPTLESP